VLTAAAVAVKDALDAPAAMVTEAGTVTALLLLDKLTAVALVTAEVIATVQASVPAPVSDGLLHEIEPIPATGACAVTPPDPVNAIVEVLAPSYMMVATPLAALADVGSKVRTSVVV
jgi:hypothetical protein